MRGTRFWARTRKSSIFVITGMQSLLHRCGMVVRRRWFACEIRPAVREIIEMSRFALQAGLLTAVLAAGAAESAAAPRVSEFAWVGSVAGVEPGSLVRIAFPADALTRLQSRAGHDVRVLNAAGDVVPYAVTGADAPLSSRHAVQTRAFPLTSTTAAAIADLRTEVQLLAALDIKGRVAPQYAVAFGGGRQRQLAGLDAGARERACVPV